MPRAENSCHLIAADRNVQSEESESRNSHRYAVVVQDLATQWLQSNPCKTKISQGPRKAWWSAWSQQGNPKSFTLTIPWNLAKPVKLSCNHCRSTPHRTETNGIAECAEWKKEHLRCHCMQSCLSNEWCPDSMECCCYPRNVQDLLSDRKTPHERRFGMPFNGLIPLEQWSNITLFLRLIEITSIWSKSLAMYIPWICIIRGKNLGRGHCGCGQKKRIGGNGRIWIPRQKAQFKGSVNVTEKSHFLCRRWNSQNGGGQRLRTSTLTWSVRNETKNKKFFKEIQMNGMLHPIFKKTQPVMMRKQKVISGRSQEDSFIVITLYQVSNCTCRKIVVVHRRYQNDSNIFGCVVGKTSWRLLERGWRTRIIWCMDRLHKIHFCWMKSHLMGAHGAGEGRGLQENKQLLVQMMYGEIRGSTCPMQQKENKTKMAI